MLYYSPSTGGFYPAQLLDTYKRAGSLPDHLVLISEELYNTLQQGQAEGKEITHGEDGLPFLRSPGKPSLEAMRDVVASARREAYSDPHTGSDRLFTEASRMQMMSEKGWEEVLAKAIQRYQEIQLEHPWPTETPA